MTDRELLQQALDALLYKGDRWWAKIRPVTEAIKARLAQPELLSEKSKGALNQEENKRHNKMILEKFYEENADLYKAQPEPVAWMYEFGTDNADAVNDVRWYKNVSLTKPHGMVRDVVSLYTAPPKKEWIGLTDEERYCNDGRSEQEIEYAKAIEAKLKEKNNG